MTDAAGSPRLTEYAELHGCSCKVGQADLASLLGAADLDKPSDDLLFGVGADAAARLLTPELALVQTVDYFTPIVDDPAAFGRVAACNALSDAFATGAVDDISLMVILALPQELTDVAPDILIGMRTMLDAVDGVIAGGHTTLNPWPLAGGAVTATAHPDALLRGDGVAPGDLLFVTKPLGTQPAMGAVRASDGEFAQTVADATPNSIAAIGEAALDWMTTPNDAAARAAIGVASAVTDVTGFGLTGQAERMATDSGVGIELTALPVLEGTPALSRLFGYGLETGESAETSGGLLVAVSPDDAPEFRRRVADAGVFCRQVGRATDGTGVTVADPTIEAIPV